MKHAWIYCLMFLLLVPSNLDAQTTTIWIGESLTEIVFDSGKWRYQSEDSSCEIKAANGKYFVWDDNHEIMRWEIGFEKLSLDEDTIKLVQGDKTLLFIQPALIVGHAFKFHAFELGISEKYSNTIEIKYHLNKYGLFQKTNFKNETLMETSISDEKMAEFEALFRKIDIHQMGNAYGRRNNCDNREYHFTFWDTEGKSYNYTAVDIRQQLLPIKEFALNLGK